MSIENENVIEDAAEEAVVNEGTEVEQTAECVEEQADEGAAEQPGEEAQAAEAPADEEPIDEPAEPTAEDAPAPETEADPEPAPKKLPTFKQNVAGYRTPRPINQAELSDMTKRLSKFYGIN